MYLSIVLDDFVARRIASRRGTVEQINDEDSCVDRRSLERLRFLGWEILGASSSRVSGQGIVAKLRVFLGEAYPQRTSEIARRSLPSCAKFRGKLLRIVVLESSQHRF